MRWHATSKPHTQSYMGCLTSKPHAADVTQQPQALKAAYAYNFTTPVFLALPFLILCVSICLVFAEYTLHARKTLKKLCNKNILTTTVEKRKKKLLKTSWKVKNILGLVFGFLYLRAYSKNFLNFPFSFQLTFRPSVDEMSRDATKVAATNLN